MYLSRSAEYSLRAMTYLARLENTTRIRTGDLAKAVDVPPTVLSKIMRRLTAAEILDSQKGHHGGFLLAKSPEEVRFIDILRAVDFEPIKDHCLYGWKKCDEQDPCPMHPQWSILKEQIEQWARTNTLAGSLEK
jgi:Rrf2 family iron-sulfur cluster assembly transcriptional regulator